MTEPSDHDTVAEVMRVEAAAIARAARRIGAADSARAVELLTGCAGNVVVSGVGKSGIVGRKVAATLTSTGTPAVFLHPADAAHGDLGIVRPGDAALLISHSGESDELLALVPHLRARGIPVVALVGHPESSLGRSADVVLSTEVDREACPLNLAPTASTAVALALGDALAMATMQARGFTPEDFARNHPAGRLGKRLTLRVRDLMHTGPAHPRLGSEASWSEVIGVLCEHSLGAVNIVHPDGRLAGLVTDGDVRRTVQRTPGADLDRLTAAGMMTPKPTTVDPEVLAYETLHLMENRPSQISVLPVVDGRTGVCLGLIRLHDLLRSGLV
jgi:arabinose-5-phosphate isomerase